MQVPWMEGISRQGGYEVDWNLVRTFISVVDSGSLAGAARELNLAHPTVARHIQQLEGQLGLDLFERASTGLKINETGRQLAEVADRMRKDALTFESVSESAKTTTQGKVRVTIAEVFADLIPELLLPLKDTTGDVERRIELVVAAEQLNLLNGEADVAVRHARPAQAELVCRKAGSLPMGAWASESYITEHGMPTLTNLADHWFVDGVSDLPFSMAVRRLGHVIPQNRVAFRTNSLLAGRCAALAGWGIAGLPDYVGRRTPGLRRVFPGDTAGVELDIWVVARPAARQQQLMHMVFQRLAETLHEKFGRRPLAPVKALDEAIPTVARG